MKEQYFGAPQPLVEYDLALSNDYTRLVEVTREATELFGTANQAYGRLGRDGLVGLAASVAPQTHEALLDLKESLAHDSGVVVLHGTGVDQMVDEQAQLTSIVISSHYGEPTKTDRRLAQIAWPVRYDPATTVQRTFSQSLGEAAFHTDTQYFEKPEEYFGLYCVRADIPGKGTNLLLNVSDITQRLSEHSPKVLETLTRPYPFRVPSVFTKSGSDTDVEIHWSPILAPDGSSIRYRKDTISAAVRTGEAVLDAEQLEALDTLEGVLATLPPIDYHLQPGDAILINNLQLLHARTYFDDPDRSLYRVRMQET